MAIEEEDEGDSTAFLIHLLLHSSFNCVLD